MVIDEVTESLIRRIQRTLTRTDKNFHLFFVLVNLPETRKVISQKLIQQLQRPVIELAVSLDTLQDTTLDGWLLPQLKTVPDNAVIFLYNLQECLPTRKKGLHRALQQLNWRRSSLAAIGRPLVIWLPRYAIDNLAEYAPDLYDWYSNVYEFIPPAEDLKQEKSRFITEFTKNEVHPAQRMNNAEKQEWLHTLTALLAENPDHNAYRAELLGNLGRLHYAIGNLDDALEQFRKELTIRQDIGDKAGEGTTLNNTSQIYTARNDYDKALSFLNKSLNIQQETNDLAGLCSTLFNIGLIHLQKEDTKKALDTWVQVYLLAKKLHLVQALQSLESLAKHLNLEGGLDGWQALAEKADDKE
ncbi:MAG: tetratricopeptide repeat protein [Thermodesulfobacteriota bacterium]|nr:tetratricopeptide repeat protein [Thermodesulfobacteriota bacterium]